LIGAVGDLRGGQVANAVRDQAVFNLDPPDGVAHLVEVVDSTPRRAVASAVDDHVDVLVVAITMSDHQRLVAAEVKASKYLVDGPVPLLGAEMLGRGVSSVAASPEPLLAACARMTRATLAGSSTP
jgi:hypothetical protein